MHTDLPLNTIKDDQLGRALFAKEIANGLVNSFRENTESIVLGINGPWGSGKSTLINFIVEEVNRISVSQRQKIIILRFNPWMFSGQKELQSIFLKELYRKLENQKDKLKKVGKKLSDLLDYLNWLKYVHSGAKEAIEDTKSLLDKLSSGKDVQKLKSEIDELLIESKVKLYITIDDIDRLTPSEITDIFQLVKLNGNFANTIFILAYDQIVVTNALEKSFGGNGKRYIEKIVQVDYTLPNVSRDNLSRIFIDSLTNLFHSDNPGLASSIEYIIEDLKSSEIVNLFSSLRDIYRFNNSIKLRLASIYQELNLKDFFLIEALRIFKPSAYEFILTSKDKLTAQKTRYTGGVGPVKNESINISKFIDENEFDPLTSSIIKSLFGYESIYYHDQRRTESLIREKKVADRAYFDRYFNLQLSDLDIKESLFSEFIHDSDCDRKISVLRDITESKRLAQFLNWLEIKSYFSESDHLESIIYACLCYSDELSFVPIHIYTIESPFQDVLRFCSRLLGRISDIGLRREIVLKHISSKLKPYSFSSVYAAHSILISKQMLDQEKLYSNHMWYPLFSTEKSDDNSFGKSVQQFYKKSLKSLMKEEFKVGDILSGEELIFILPEVEKNHKQFYQKEFEKYIEDDRRLIDLLTLCITRSFFSAGNIIGYQLAENQLLPGMEKDNIWARLSEVDDSELNNDQKATIAFYKQAYNDGFIEKKFYDFYTLEDVGKGLF